VHVFGLQWRARETLVDIAHDRLGLVEREAVMLEAGDLGERLARQVRLFAVCAERHVDQFMRHALSASASRALHT
jgi:hypothetical protein